MVAMRFHEKEYEVIKKKADKASLNFTEFVTRSALDKPIVVIDGLGNVLKEQKAIGRNLNQLTTLCNMGKIVCPDLSEIINQYSAVYNRLTETGWESERKYLFNGEATEEDGEYIGRTEKEMATDIDWSTDSGTNSLLDSLYTMASAAEIIRKPTTKTPRQAKNKKKGLGQREDDHSGDYQNNNELYYGSSM